MKILFAVSNENVSNRIVDSYKKKYGEMVSSKNVFYFNAIIRELHNDKTYDRIVISEDLEPFSNSNYDVIDRFILERLKQVANEVNAQDRYIDIVVICTDRRSKSGFVLTKMYEYGIYNALVGKDRRIDNVCDLLNTPRTAEEAKEYYNIVGTTNDTSSVDDVSEQEVQNILLHYKRLGKNEDRYTDSFNNIASQYTDKQLKIIIKCLPINVRAVLEAECPKYQELVTYAEETEEERKEKEKIRQQRRIAQIENERRLKQKIEKDKRDAARLAQKRENNINGPQLNQKNNKNSGIDLIDNKNKEPRMTGNVIIPNNMNVKNERKIITDDEIPSQTQIRSKAPVKNEIKPNTMQNDVVLPGFEDFDEITSQEVVEPEIVPNDAVLPGLKDFDEEPVQEVVEPETVPNDAVLPGLEDFDEEPVQEVVEPETVPNDAVQPGLENLDEIASQKDAEQEVLENDQTQEVPETKRGRGRPRKYPVEPPKPKGKRGRPRKNPLPEESSVENGNLLISNVNELENIPQIENIKTNESLSQVEQSYDDDYQENRLPGVDNWYQDPLDADTSTIEYNESDDELIQNANQAISTLPGFEESEPLNDVQDDDWNQNPFEENKPLNDVQDDDWNQDPFEENKPLNDVQDDGWNQDPFEENKPLNDVQDDGWNQDPFEESKPLNDVQGDDWNRDPFEESKPLNDVQDDDWNRDPFEESKPLNDVQDNDWNDNQVVFNNIENENVSQINQGNLDQSQFDNFQTNDSSLVSAYNPTQDRIDTLQKIEENKIYSTGSLNTVLTKDKKIVAFVGAGKNGTSFLVNSLACLFSSIGVKTAILDMTQNKNSYYIYTNNDEKLRNIAYTSIENLEKGIAEGIKVDRNLEVYTALPNDRKDYSNAEAILSTLIQNVSLVLIDCDFQTNYEYFASAQEIYLVQSMDILTIQPLTAFLRELKTRGILEQEKLRIVINKELKVRSLSGKAVIGGMSFYNDPAMSYMTELFNKDKVKACSIPFDEGVYAKYLEQLVNCNISISGYNKGFMNSLKILGNMVYPLLSKQTYNSNNQAGANYGNTFSSEMNNTLNQMKNKY